VKRPTNWAAIVAAGGWNLSHEFLSAKAKAQLRDSKGRFIPMGGLVRWMTANGWRWGFVTNIGDNGAVKVRAYDGKDYSIGNKSLEVVKALLPDNPAEAKALNNALEKVKHGLTTPSAPKAAPKPQPKTGKEHLGNLKVGDLIVGKYGAIEEVTQAFKDEPGGGKITGYGKYAKKGTVKTKNVATGADRSISGVNFSTAHDVEKVLNPADFKGAPSPTATPGKKLSPGAATAKTSSVESAKLKTGDLIKRPDGSVWRVTNEFSGTSSPASTQKHGEMSKQGTVDIENVETGVKAKLQGNDHDPAFTSDKFDHPDEVWGDGGSTQASDAADEETLSKIAEKLTPVDPKDDAEPLLFVDTSGFTKVGGQGGSNPGGTYEDPATGDKFYVKQAQSEQHAANEVLAARLYDAAGVRVPDVYLTELDGGPAVASRIIPDLQPLYPGGHTTPATLKEGRKGFSMDAWLANWDSVGLVYDNMMKDKDGHAVRVDTGGALLYRAQGAPKGGLFTDTVGETETLRSTKNAQSHKIFGGMTDQDVAEDVKNTVNKVPDSLIDKLIDELPFSSDEVKQELNDRIKKRRKNLNEKFDIAPSPAAPDGKPVMTTGPTLTNEQAKDTVSTLAMSLKVGDQVKLPDGTVGTLTKKDLVKNQLHFDVNGIDVQHHFFKADHWDKVKSDSDKTPEPAATNKLDPKTLTYADSIASKLEPGDVVRLASNGAYVYYQVQDSVKMTPSGPAWWGKSVNGITGEVSQLPNKMQLVSPHQKVMVSKAAVPEPETAQTPGADQPKALPKDLVYGAVGASSLQVGDIVKKGSAMSPTFWVVDEPVAKKHNGVFSFHASRLNNAGKKTSVSDEFKLDHPNGIVDAWQASPKAPTLKVEKIGKHGPDGVDVTLTISQNLKPGDIVKHDNGFWKVTEPLDKVTGTIQAEKLDGTGDGDIESLDAAPGGIWQKMDGVPNQVKGDPALQDVQSQEAGSSAADLKKYKEFDKKENWTGVNALDLQPGDVVAMGPASDQLYLEIAKSDGLGTVDGTLYFKHAAPAQKVEGVALTGLQKVSKAAQPDEIDETGVKVIDEHPMKTPDVAQPGPDDWSPDEIEVIEGYTNEDYTNINYWLRTQSSTDKYGNQINVEHVDWQASVLFEMISKSETMNDSYVYRGASANHLLPPGGYKTGDPLIDKAFVSTSKSFEVAKNFPLKNLAEQKKHPIIEIFLPAGTPLLDVDQSGVGFGGENEFLLPPNAPIIFDEEGVLSNGRRYIRAHLDPDWSDNGSSTAPGELTPAKQEKIDAPGAPAGVQQPDDGGVPTGTPAPGEAGEVNPNKSKITKAVKDFQPGDVLSPFGSKSTSEILKITPLDDGKYEVQYKPDGKSPKSLVVDGTDDTTFGTVVTSGPPAPLKKAGPKGLDKTPVYDLEKIKAATKRAGGPHSLDPGSQIQKITGLKKGDIFVPAHGAKKDQWYVANSDYNPTDQSLGAKPIKDDGSIGYPFIYKWGEANQPAEIYQLADPSDGLITSTDQPKSATDAPNLTPPPPVNPPTAPSPSPDENPVAKIGAVVQSKKDGFTGKVVNVNTFTGYSLVQSEDGTKKLWRSWKTLDLATPESQAKTQGPEDTSFGDPSQDDPVKEHAAALKAHAKSVDDLIDQIEYVPSTHEALENIGNGSLKWNDWAEVSKYVDFWGNGTDGTPGFELKAAWNELNHYADIADEDISEPWNSAALEGGPAAPGEDPPATALEMAAAHLSTVLTDDGLEDWGNVPLDTTASPDAIKQWLSDFVESLNDAHVTLSGPTKDAVNMLADELGVPHPETGPQGTPTPVSLLSKGDKILLYGEPSTITSISGPHANSAYEMFLQPDNGGSVVHTVFGSSTAVQLIKKADADPAASPEPSESSPVKTKVKDTQVGDVFETPIAKWEITAKKADPNFPDTTVISAKNLADGHVLHDLKYPSDQNFDVIKKATAPSPETPEELTKPGIPTGTLVPGSDHVYQDAQGKYAVTKAGHVLREGMAVKSTKDGFTGEIVQLEKGPRYAKVKGPDGKIKGRQLDTLEPAEKSIPSKFTPEQEYEKGLITAEEYTSLTGKDAPGAAPAPSVPEKGEPIAAKDLTPGMIFKVGASTYKVNATKTLLNGKVSLDLADVNTGQKFSSYTVDPNVGKTDGAWKLISVPDGGLVEPITPEVKSAFAPKVGDKIKAKDMVPGMVVESASGNNFKIHDTKVLPSGAISLNMTSTKTGKNFPDHPLPADFSNWTIKALPADSTKPVKLKGSEIKTGDTVWKFDGSAPLFKIGTVVEDLGDGPKTYTVEGIDPQWSTPVWVVGDNTELMVVKGDPAAVQTPDMTPDDVLAGTLYAGSSHVYKDALGKFVVNKQGYVLREGMKVTSTKDGLTGTVSFLELGPKYAKVLTPEGLLKGRQIDTLKPADPSAKKLPPGTVPGGAPQTPAKSVKDYKVGDQVLWNGSPATVDLSEASHYPAQGEWYLSVDLKDGGFHAAFLTDDGAGAAVGKVAHASAPVTVTPAGGTVPTPAAPSIPPSKTFKGEAAKLEPGKVWKQVKTVKAPALKAGQVVGNDKKTLEYQKPSEKVSGKWELKFVGDPEPLTVSQNLDQWQVWQQVQPGMVGKMTPADFSLGQVIELPDGSKHEFEATSEWGDTPGHIDVKFKNEKTWTSLEEHTQYQVWEPGTATTVSPDVVEEPTGPVQLNHDPIDFGFPEGGAIKVPPAGKVYKAQYWSNQQPVLIDGFNQSWKVDSATGELTPFAIAPYYGKSLTDKDVLVENPGQADVTPDLDAALSSEDKTLLVDTIDEKLGGSSVGNQALFKALKKLLNDPTGQSLTKDDWGYVDSSLNQLWWLGVNENDSKWAGYKLEVAKLRKKVTGTYSFEWSGGTPKGQFFYDANERKALSALGLSADAQTVIGTKYISPSKNPDVAAEIHAVVSDPARAAVIDDLFGHGTSAKIAQKTRGSRFMPALSGNLSPYAKQVPDLPSTDGKNGTVIYLGDNVIASDGQGGQAVLVTLDGKVRVRRADGSHFTRKGTAFVTTGTPVAGTKPTTTFTAKPRPDFELPDWSKGNVGGTASLQDVLTRLKSSDRAGNIGWSFAGDDGQIEDLDVHVSRVLSAAGQELLEFKFKFTPKHGNAMFNRHSVDDKWTESLMKIDGRQLTSSDKLAQLTGSTTYTGHGGRTLLYQKADGTEIRFHRANNKQQNKNGSNPAAFHNLVQVRLPATASQGDIAKALYDAGVDRPGPASPAAVKRLGENRLLALFAKKTDSWAGNDGIQNRDALLEQVKKEWGVTADQLEIAHGANGRFEIRLPEFVTDKIIKKTGVKYFLHSLSGGQTDLWSKLGKNPFQALLSTSIRRTEGVKAEGASSTADVHSGGADYVFTRPRGTMGGQFANSLVFSAKRLFRRMDWFTQDYDSWGNYTNGLDIIGKTSPHATETMFKHRLDLDDAVGFFVSNETTRQDVINTLKAHGITYLGSRTVEEFVMVAPNTDTEPTTAPVDTVPIASFLGGLGL
jgi:hypothetical protein